MSIRSLLGGLVEAGVEFVVIGGVAGAVHGSPFVTNDLDVCYGTGNANVGRLVKTIAKWSPYPRGWEASLPFVMDIRTLRTTPITTLRTSHGDLDLLDRVEGIGDYDAVFESSEEITVFSLRFRVLTLDALLRARKASGRPKDRAQIPTLEALADIKETGGF